MVRNATFLAFFDLVLYCTIAMKLRYVKNLARSTILTLRRSYYFSPTSPQLQSNGLLQLAIALVFDLALNRPVREFESPAEILSDSSRNAPVTAKEVKRSTEERRALLSCYFLTSV